VAKSNAPGADASIGPRRNRRTLRRRLTALFVIVGVLAQFAWLVVWETETAPNEGPPPYTTNVTPLLIVGSIGSALLFCAVLLYVPEGIRRARQAYREHQEFKDRFR
jgi:hypothetical protein